MILKAIRPLDDMIAQLNDISAHIHSVLKLHPSHLLKPQLKVDETILAYYQQTFAAYDPPVRSLLSVVESELRGSIISIAGQLGTRLSTIGTMFLNNILMDADEASVTALVTETESLFSSTREQLVPLLSQSLLSLHDNLSGKFNSNALQSSFSAIAEITAAIPRFLDALIPQQQMMDYFLRILKLRHATEALESNLTHNTLCALLNEIETEFERESEKIDALFGLRGRTLHAHVKRTPNSESLAAPLGDAVIAFGRLWTKYIRKFSRASSDLLGAQLHCTVPVSWSASVRDCIALALIHSNDYFTRKSVSISQKLLLECVSALFEPLTQSLIQQLSNSLGPIVTTTLATQTIPAPPNHSSRSHPNSPGSSPSTNSDDCNLSELLETNMYLCYKIRKLFGDSLKSVLHETVLTTLHQAWEVSPERCSSSEAMNRRARLEGMLLRMRSELQKHEMDGEVRRDSFSYDERRATMAGTFVSSAAALPPAGLSPYTSAGIGPALVHDAPITTYSAIPTPEAPAVAAGRRNRAETGKSAPSFSEAPVARMLGRLQVDPTSASTSPLGDSSPASGGTKTDLDDKRLGNDLVMLSRMSVHGGAKIAASEASSSSGPALIFNFDVAEPKFEEPAPTASGIWAAAAASQTQYRRSTRVYYDVPEFADAFIDPNKQTSPHSTASPSSPTTSPVSPRHAATSTSDHSGVRHVPKKPTLTARIPRSRPTSQIASAPTSPASKTAPSNHNNGNNAPSSSVPTPSPPLAAEGMNETSSSTPPERKRWTNSLTPGASAILTTNTRTDTVISSSSPPNNSASASPPINHISSSASAANTSRDTSAHTALTHPSVPASRPSLVSLPLPPVTDAPPPLVSPSTLSTPQFTLPSPSIRIKRSTAQSASIPTSPSSTTSPPTSPKGK